MENGHGHVVKKIFSMCQAVMVLVPATVGSQAGDGSQTTEHKYRV